MSPKSHDRNLRNRTLAVIAGTVVVIAGSTIGYRQVTDGGGGGGDNLANLWMDTNGGACTWSGIQVTYSDATACGTLDAAYDVANTNSPTGTVEVQIKGGIYTSDQTLSGDRTGTGRVSFLEACGESVTFTAEVTLGEGSTGADYLTFGDCEAVTTRGQGLDMDQGFDCVDSDCTNITIDAVDGGSVAIAGAAQLPTHWLVSNGDWGPCWSSGPNKATNCTVFNGGSGAQIEIDNDLDDLDFVNNNIHDHHLVGINDHYECIRGIGGPNQLWSGNRFWNCQIYSLNVGPHVGPNVIIENNWFGGAMNADADPVLHDTPRCTDVSTSTTSEGPIYIRFNSFQDCGGVFLDVPAPPTDSVYVIGNTIGTRDCIPNVVYQYNVYDDNQSDCASSDSQIAGEFPYVSNTMFDTMDYHITGASWLGDGFVPCGSVTGGCPSTDVDGESRGSTADAGSDER